MSDLENKVINAVPAITVFNMNRVFGNDPVMVTDVNWVDRVVNQSLNIGDEIEELQEAVANNDLVEIADAVGDIFTFAYGTDYFLSGSLFTKECGNYQAKTLASDLTPALSELDDLYHDLRCILDDLADLGTNLNPDEFVEFVNMFGSSLRRLLDQVGNNFVFFDFHGLMDEVTSSNLTKVCLTIDERNATLKHYQNLGIEVYSHATPMLFEGVEYYVVYSSADQTDKNGKVYRKDKFLKNVARFRDPCLDFVLAA